MGSQGVKSNAIDERNGGSKGEAWLKVRGGLRMAYSHTYDANVRVGMQGDFCGYFDV
jgi:hypothetical protein